MYLMTAWLELETLVVKLFAVVVSYYLHIIMFSYDTPMPLPLSIRYLDKLCWNRAEIMLTKPRVRKLTDVFLQKRELYNYDSSKRLSNIYQTSRFLF